MRQVDSTPHVFHLGKSQRHQDFAQPTVIAVSGSVSVGRLEQAALHQ
jgi:hypothetical protein